MFKAFFTCIGKYITFSGRARRREYWLFWLCNFLISCLLGGVSAVFLVQQKYQVAEALSMVTVVYALFVFLPGLAVTVRRLHDTDHSGAYIFMGLIPLAGPIILLVAMCTESSLGENRYGPSPKQSAPAAPSPLEEAFVPTEETSENTAVTGGDTGPLAPTVMVQKGVRAVCVKGPNAGTGKEADVIYVGRDASRCQLVLKDAPGVSRMHCMLRALNDGIEVRDLGSSYGTYLQNGKRLEANAPVVLPSGSTIYLGSKSVAVAVEFI